MVYFFEVKKCKACPLREGCFKEGAKTKTYPVAIKSEEYLDQQTFQETEEFKRLAQERYKIEAKNSELKNQASAAGSFGMQIQGATTIFAVNLKRILKLLNGKG
ncbi:transposase [Bacillus thuringiensis serovar yunnanensis]|nr:transposase [Bacillus thuringiensis serovar yunnanensis]